MMMTGAKNFAALKDGLQFDLPKQRGYVRDGISRIHVILNASDTYTVKGFKIKNFECDEIISESGIYCDMLQNTFEQMTGLRTRL
jgi:hypothetical protein